MKDEQFTTLHPWLKETFGGSGHEFYYVGGCVRDTILKRTAKDFDIATSAKPEEVQRLFVDAGHVVVHSGEGFGGVTIVNGETGERIECTTFRADGQYKDSRRPESIRFARTIGEDLARRDFTINAMAADPWTGDIIDPFNGVAAIRDRSIRAVGDPYERIREDGLRIIRAARFAAQLDFWIEEQTLNAMHNTGSIVMYLPPERIHGEIIKAMSGRDPGAFWSILRACELLRFVSLELDDLVGLEQPREYHAFTAFEHSLLVLRYISEKTRDPVLRFIALHHDIGKAKTFQRKPDGTPTFPQHEKVGAHMIETLMERLRFPNADIQRASKLVRFHLVPYDGSWSDGTIRRWREDLGPWWDDLMLLREADLKGHGKVVSTQLGHLRELQERVLRLKEKKEDLAPRLAINGHDVMRLLALEEGPEVGAVLRRLKDVITEDPSKNTREVLEDEIRRTVRP